MADLRQLADTIEDGALIALAPDYAGTPMALVRALIRARRRDLRLVGVPQLGLAADLLIAAGCVAEIETAAISLGEWGVAPAFDRAYRAGRVRVRETTCPVIHSGLQAAEKGLPFMPIRGVIGSDLPAIRADWKVIDNPFEPFDPILAVPAIRPDFALIHALIGDLEGNLFIGVRRELMLMAHASARTFATFDEREPEDLLRNTARAGATIPALYIASATHVPHGSKPVGLWGAYGPDAAWFARYVEAASSPTALAHFLDAWLEAEIEPA